MVYKETSPSSALPPSEMVSVTPTHHGSMSPHSSALATHTIHSHTSMDEEDDFVDAPEHQSAIHSEADRMTNNRGDQDCAREHSELGSLSERSVGSSHGSVEDGVEWKQSPNHERDEEMLLSSSHGEQQHGGAESNSPSLEKCGEEPIHETIEPDEKIQIQKFSGSDQYLAAYLAAIGKGHSDGCDGSRGHSTPSPTPPRTCSVTAPERMRQETGAANSCPPPAAASYMGPDPARDLSKNLKSHVKFHNKASNLIPRIPLAKHRYWIGVLAPEREPRNVSKEEHMTWMKGNRFTTVETVYRIFENTTATTDFVLLLGMERVSFADRMEELDIFGDKAVILRAVKEKLPEAKGRLVTEGLIPPERTDGDVIEID